MARDTWNNFIW